MIIISFHVSVYKVRQDELHTHNPSVHWESKWGKQLDPVLIFPNY